MGGEGEIILSLINLIPDFDKTNKFLALYSLRENMTSNIS